jgi:hypothetical protein
MFVDPSGLLENYVFKLNKQEFSALTNERTHRSYPAFSGNGEHRNNPASIAVKNIGPLPIGSYYIVERKSSTGRFCLDWISGKTKWFSLYASDGVIDDKTVVNNVQRGEFRLHYGTTSLGCITIRNEISYEDIRNELLSTKTSIIPGTNIPYYGTITVVDAQIKVNEASQIKINQMQENIYRDNLITNNPFFQTMPPKRQ